MVSEVKLKISVDGTAQVSSQLSTVDSGLDKLGAGIQRIGHYGAALLGLSALQGAVGNFARVSDSVTQLNNQLRLAAPSADAAAAAYGRLFAIAQQSRLSFTDLGGTYSRIARATGELGISQERLLGVTKAIGDAVAVSGSSAEAANAALLQLGQGMAAGALRGEELNSVMEQTPRLAKAIADGLGVTIGELRKMGEQGELTAQNVIGALESQAGVLGKEVAGSVTTISQAMTQLGNSVALLVGQMNKATGASGVMAQAVQVFSGGAQAIAEAMARAERDGGGWLRQLNDGTGMLIGRTLGLQLLSRDFMTLQGAVDDARRTIAYFDDLQQRGAVLSIYALKQRADAVRDLARASRELAAASPSAGSGSVGSGDTAVRRLQEADAARRAKLAADLRAKYATPQEKLDAELQRQREELGPLFTPDDERRIRERFIKPTNAAAKAADEAADAIKRAKQAHNDWLSQRGLQALARDDAAEQEADRKAKAAEAYAQRWREIDEQRSLDAIDKAVAAEEKKGEAAQKANEQIEADWQRSVDQMGQSLSDALMNGGKSARDYLQGLFRNLVLRPILMPSATAISSFISGPAAAASGGGGGGALGTAGSLLSIGSSVMGGIGALGGALAGGATATLSGVGLGGLMSGAGSMIGMGSAAGVMGGAGLAIGAIAPYAIAALGAYALGKKLFGRKHADSGIEGTFDASGDFSGNSFDFYKGGTFRRDKTKRGALDSGTESVLDAGAAAMAATTRSYAEVLGLPVKAIEGFSQQIKLSLKGLNEEQVKQAIEGAVQGFGEGMAARFGIALSTFQRAGESMAETLARLAGLQAFSNTLSDLGGVFERIAGLGIDAREGLIQLAGGIEAMGQKALQFVQDYYSRDEIAGLKAGEIQAALKAVGITQDINSRDEYRALLDSLDVSSETGRQQFAALLDMAQAFTGVADFLTEAGRTLSQAAAGAPQSNGATALFAQGGAADQVLAINNVGFWTERVFQAIKEQTALIASGSGAAATGPARVEVNGWSPNGPIYDRN